MRKMVDPDSLIPEGAFSAMAIALDAAMRASATARADYARIWGCEYAPLTVAGATMLLADMVAEMVPYVAADVNARTGR